LVSLIWESRKTIYLFKITNIMKISKLFGTSLGKNDYEFTGLDTDNHKIDICYRFKRLVVLSDEIEVLNVKNSLFSDNLNEIQKVLIPLGVTFSEGVSLIIFSQILHHFSYLVTLADKISSLNLLYSEENSTFDSDVPSVSTSRCSSTLALYLFRTSLMSSCLGISSSFFFIN